MFRVFRRWPKLEAGGDPAFVCAATVQSLRSAREHVSVHYVQAGVRVHVTRMLEDPTYWAGICPGLHVSACPEGGRVCVHRRSEPAPALAAPVHGHGGPGAEDELRRLGRDGVCVLNPATPPVLLAGLSAAADSLHRHGLPPAMLWVFVQPWELLLGAWLPRVGALLGGKGEGTGTDDSGRATSEVDLRSLGATRLDLCSAPAAGPETNPAHAAAAAVQAEASANATAAFVCRFRRGRPGVPLASAAASAHGAGAESQEQLGVAECSVDLASAGAAPDAPNWLYLPPKHDAGYLSGAGLRCADGSMLMHVRDAGATAPGSIVARTHRVFCWRRKPDHSEHARNTDADADADADASAPADGERPPSLSTLHFSALARPGGGGAPAPILQALGRGKAPVVLPAVWSAVFDGSPSAPPPPLRFRVALAAALALLNPQEARLLSGEVRGQLWHCFLAVSENLFEPAFAREVYSSYTEAGGAGDPCGQEAA